MLVAGVFVSRSLQFLAILKKKKSMVCKEFSDIQALKVHGI